MRGKRKLLMILAGCLLASSVLAGCGKQMTSEKLLMEMEENCQKAESIEGDFDFGMVIGMEESGVSMNMGMGMDGTFEMMNTPAVMHLKGAMNIDLMNLKMDMELYTKQEDGKTTAYVKLADQWNKTEQETGAEAEEKTGSQDIFGEWELSDKTEKVEGRESYVLTGKVSGEKLEELLAPLKEAMESQGGNADFKGADIPLTLKVYKDSKLPASVEIDMNAFVSSILKAAPSENGGTITTEDCKLVITFKQYDQVKGIEIPKEALEADEQGIPALAGDLNAQ